MSEVKIRVGAADQAFARLRAAARRIDAGEHDTHEFGLNFETPELLFSVLTAGRWRLLAALRQHGPSSIRGLAGALGRDYKAVHGDVSKLIEVGLIDRDEAGLISVPWTRITAEMNAEAA